ncbi:MAG TPA: tetratricopeptide repeat protein [Stellaceae bacterium]
METRRRRGDGGGGGLSMILDPRGIPVTASDAASAARLEHAIIGYGGFRADTGERLKAALADPGLVMAPVLRGYFMLLLTKRELVSRAEQAANVAEAAMTQAGATPRERLHLQALRAWIGRDCRAAAAILKRILAEYPHDLVALKLAQYLLFYQGDWRDMRDTVATAIASWDAAAPGYGYALGCHAFGLEECGDYAEAERLGRRAVALASDDIWGAHAVAHCCEMQDRSEDGLAWLDEAAVGWRDANNFAFHVHWHRCLFLLELGRFDEVLARYDREVRAESTDEYLDITNAVALLWRLEQLGVAVGRRWDELAARAAARIDDHMLAFGDAHYAVALAAAGHADDYAWWRRSSAAYAQAGETQSAVTAEVGLALGDAALAHRRGEYGRAVDLLWPVRASVRRIGGSHAQRDFFAKLLIDSAVQAKRIEVARTLLGERLAARPNNRWGQAMAARAG